MDAERDLITKRAFADSSSFLSSSEVVDVHIPVDDTAFDFDCPHVSAHDSPICYAGLANVNCVCSVPVHHDFFVVLMNPNSITQRVDVTSSTQCALRSIRRLSPYAIDFTLRTVRCYTANESLSFSIAKSHLSQLFIDVCG
jgi:hypothetical protein